MNKRNGDNRECSRMGFAILRLRSGFSIVELLVVVVVIGALSMLVVNYYSGKTKDGKSTIIAPKEGADDVSMRIDYSNAISQIRIYQAENDTLPLANDCNPAPAQNTVCFKPSGGNVINYKLDNTTSPPSLSLSVTRKVGDKTYYIDKDSYPLVKSDKN